MPQFPFAGGPNARMLGAAACGSLFLGVNRGHAAGSSTKKPQVLAPRSRSPCEHQWGQEVGLGAMEGGSGRHAVPGPLPSTPAVLPSTHQASQFGMVSSLVSRDALHARSRSSFLTGRRKGSQGRRGHPQTPACPSSTPAPLCNFAVTVRGCFLRSGPRDVCQGSAAAGGAQCQQSWCEPPRTDIRT